jgi:hypothetical protein
VKVGVVTRNITNNPVETLTRLFDRHGIEPDLLDFLVHLPLSEDKLPYFRRTREEFGINPARAYACGDEAKDFRAAVNTGMHPFMVSYGFEDFDRLHLKHEIPTEVISRTPDELVVARAACPRAGCGLTEAKVGAAATAKDCPESGVEPGAWRAGRKPSLPVLRY